MDILYFVEQSLFGTITFASQYSPVIRKWAFSLS